MPDTGFVDVNTRTAGAHSSGVPNLGTFAVGAGPTVDPDAGTVLLATLEGKVIALHPDGSAAWTGDAAARAGERFTASPAVDSHHAVFAVGVRSATVRDHRTNETYNTSFATIRKFVNGAEAGSTPFPEVRTGAHPGMHGPRVVGRPIRWRSGPFDEAVMVPVMYVTIGGYELHILACSTNAGVILGDVTVAEWNGGDVTGEDANFWFEHGSIDLPHAFPGLTVFTHPQGIDPYIIIVNPFQNEIVGYTFCVGSSCAPAGFTQRFRTAHAPAVLTSAPTTLPDLHTAAGTNRGIVFSGPAAAVAPVEGLSPVYGKPALTASGRAVVITREAVVVTLENRAIASRLDLHDLAAVGAAASRNHVFVSSSTGLHTLDAEAGTELLRFPWVGGGSVPPAIGPEGHVYAMASNALFVFPPPLHVRPIPGDAPVVERNA